MNWSWIYEVSSCQLTNEARRRRPILNPRNPHDELNSKKITGAGKLVVSAFKVHFRFISKPDDVRAWGELGAVGGLFEKNACILIAGNTCHGYDDANT
jgi:hypothetical protein